MANASELNELDRFFYVGDDDNSTMECTCVLITTNGTTNGTINGTTAAVENIVSSNDSEIIRMTLRNYGTFYLVVILLVSFMRWKYPRLFSIRSWVPEHQCDLALKQYRNAVSWYWEVFNESDDDILEQCGMDALCFLRALRLGRKIAMFGCFNAIWLLPVYGTAPISDETFYLTDPLVKVSVANVPNHSPRFLATVIAAYLMFIKTMYLILEDFEWYTEYRHKFLSQNKPRNYAVYVSGIPESNQSSSSLLEYFRECSSDSAVLEAHVARDMPKLEQKVARREAIITTLEHAYAYERVKGRPLTHRKVGLRGIQTVETDEVLEKELLDLNKYITEEINKISNAEHPLRSQFRKSAANKTKAKSLAMESWDYASDSFSTAKPEPSTRKVTLSVSESYLGDEKGDLQKDSQSKIDIESGIQLSWEKFDKNLFENSRSWPMSTGDDDGSTDTFYSSVLNEEFVDKEMPKKELILNTYSEISNKLSVYESFDDVPLAGGLSRDDVECTAEADINHDARDENEPTPVDAKKEVLQSKGHTKKTYLGVSPFKNVQDFGGTLKNQLVSTGGAVTKQVVSAGDNIQKVGGAVTKQVAATAGDNIVAVGGIGVDNLQKHGVDGVKMATDIGNQLIGSAAVVVPINLLLSQEEGKPRSAGFVVFSDLHTTHAALQMIHHPTPYVMEVSEAPDPEDIFWKNVGLPARAKRTGKLLSLAATTALCFFWSVPVAFIASLTEVNSIKATIPPLGTLIDNYPWVEMFLAQLAPILLMLLNDVVLPGCLSTFAMWEGHVANPELEASFFKKLAAFMIIQTFFVSAISGSIWAELTNLLNNPGHIIEFLANSLPAQSSYFVQICFVNVFLGLGLDLLRIKILGKALIRRYAGSDLTEKERSQPWHGFFPLHNPDDFSQAETLAPILLFFMVSFVYSTSAPVTNFFLAVCFLAMESGYRYQFFHNKVMGSDSGGKLWRGFIIITLACMMTAQITLIGILILKQSVYAVPFMGPMIVGSLMFIFYINIKHFHVTNHLPTRECVRMDRENRENGLNVLDFVKEKYIQPCLQNRELHPE